MKQSLSDRIFQGFSYTFILAFSLFCLFPFWYMVSGSITDENELIFKGYSLFPHKISYVAYKLLFQSGTLLRSYQITIVVTVIGTTLALLISALLAYSLSNRRNVFRNPLLFIVYIPMLFSGGLVPFYITVSRWLDLKDTIWAMILPLLCQPFLVFLLVSFFRTIPQDLEDAARMDGASEARLFFQVIVPISKPILATVGLFYALNYWNDWFMSLMFVDNNKLFPLQLILRRMVSNFIAAKNLVPANSAITIDAPTMGIRMATTVITIGPIIFLYPFLQKYFVKGLTIGAVKG